ncbi:MAG: hypothetical protein HY301_03090 [Verrucomicrobia bacterium]|nr:hypothetical protein [Verrucomicrobiota bacterium]
MRAMLRCCLLILLLAAVTVSAADKAEFGKKLAELQKPLAANPTNAAALFAVAKYCHDIGAKDNEEAAKLAEKYFNDLLKLQPSNALATAYLGSTLTMRARDTFWPTRRLSLVKEGNRLMDRAVTLATNDLTVRMTRAMNNVHMPAWLDREALVRDDLAWLWEQVQQRPAAFVTGDKQDVAHYHGVMLFKAKQKEKAKEIWEAGLALDPNSPEAAEIRAEQKKLK